MESIITPSEAIKKVLEIGIPAMVSMFLAIFMEVLNNAFVGHLGREDILAGVGMANMHMNIFLLSLIWGMNSTLNTLLTQAKGFGDLR
jgi:Na+-driven multidrug efflux pump